jgi:hypothetical protein
MMIVLASMLASQRIATETRDRLAGCRYRPYVCPERTRPRSLSAANCLVDSTSQARSPW